MPTPEEIATQIQQPEFSPGDRVRWRSAPHIDQQIEEGDIGTVLFVRQIAGHIALRIKWDKTILSRKDIPMEHITQHDSLDVEKII